jgi:hypothetical protein
MEPPFIAGRRVKDYRRIAGAKRIHLEHLPGYAPELHPQEGVWYLLKRVELKNVCCLDVLHVQRARAQSQRTVETS